MTEETPIKCPFCGSTDVERVDTLQGSWDECRGCGATGPTRMGGTPRAQWNSRHYADRISVRFPGGQLYTLLVAGVEPGAGVVETGPENSREEMAPSLSGGDCRTRHYPIGEGGGASFGVGADQVAENIREWQQAVGMVRCADPTPTFQVTVSLEDWETLCDLATKGCGSSAKEVAEDAIRTCCEDARREARTVRTQKVKSENTVEHGETLVIGRAEILEVIGQHTMLVRTTTPGDQKTKTFVLHVHDCKWAVSEPDQGLFPAVGYLRYGMDGQTAESYGLIPTPEVWSDIDIEFLGREIQKSNLGRYRHRNAQTKGPWVMGDPRKDWKP